MSSKRPGTTRHQVHLPRRSPVIRPASARMRVWCELVGWHFPRGPFWLQLQIAPSAAMIESSPL
jgi:hypothetical protein